MNEWPSQQPENKKEDSGSVHFTRHSKADYETYFQIKSSDNPRRGIDPENQIFPDVPEAGIELAEQKAEELLSRFNSDTDVLFFASSNEVRAIETANIYRKLAHKKGFEILKPDKVGLNLADQIGEGEIRIVRNLSLNNNDLLLQALFNPDAYNKSVKWDLLDDETREKCDHVRAMIREHDYGSFGPNFFHYSEKVQEIFPEVRSAKDLYDHQFQNLLRLAEFGMQKIREAGLEKKVKILAFGHENYMSYALDKYFQQHDIKNCETVDINITNDGVELIKGGITKSIE